MTRTAPLVAFNCTAYDDRPSGARTRAVGLAAALLGEGADVVLYVPRGCSLRAAVAHEAGGTECTARLHEVRTPLDPGAPVARAVRSDRWFRRHLTRDAYLFVTDYYPVIAAVPTAVTVHDLRYLAAPGDEARRRVVWFRMFYPRLLRRARHVIVPTMAVASEVVCHLGVAADRVRVVSNGLSRAWRDARPASGDVAHLLWVGTSEPRKRLDFLLRAYAIAAASAALRPLVLVGRGADAARLPDCAAALVDAGQVIPRGVVGDDELVALCRGAAALLHPSRYEGCGLPVVEALAVRTPVLAARIAAVAEVARGGARLLPPDDLSAWVRALGQVGRVDLPPERPECRVVRAAREATWRCGARALLDVIRA